MHFIIFIYVHIYVYALNTNSPIQLCTYRHKHVVQLTKEERTNIIIWKSRYYYVDLFIVTCVNNWDQQVQT